jgi:hypothetical protein
MKKLFAFAIMLAALAGFAGIGFAQDEVREPTVDTAAVIEVLTGTVVSVDAATNAVVVKDETTGIERTVTATPAMIGTIKAGDKVKVSIGEEMEVKDIVKVTEEKKTEAMPAEAPAASSAPKTEAVPEAAPAAAK